MKNIAIILLVMVLLCGCASAVTVNVTISDGQGNLVVANKAFDVNDADADGTISICDALYAAHEADYEGGAEAGFVTADTDYGRSIVSLWGEENGGSYGYYVNNTSAYSLNDIVNEGDHVHAYVFTDLIGWTDTYCYFDKENVEAAIGESFELILNMQSFDADWNPLLVPAEGAVITINGADSEFITDAEGKAAIAFEEAGTYLLSAHSDTVNLVAPVCTVNVK